MNPSLGLALGLFWLICLPSAKGRDLSADEVMNKAVKHVRVPTENNRIRMVLYNKQGHKRERVMSLAVATTDGEDRSLVRFDYPGGIRGTALLSKEEDGGKDHQWLFMPVLGRTRRIASTQMGDSFVGSEMAYEDTKVLRLEDWRFKKLGKQKLAGRTCYLIESRPAPRHETSYGKTHTWIDAETFVGLKTVFFDKQDRKLKHVVSTGFRQVAAGVWRARVQTFESLVTGQKTVLQFEKTEINCELEEALFDPRRLSQWR